MPALRDKKSSLAAARAELRALAEPARAKSTAAFFKCGPGEYGEGDVFLGIAVPKLRGVAKAHGDLSLEHLSTLLHSKLHEERLLALIVLVNQYEKGDAEAQAARYAFYLEHLARVNNWDLIVATYAFIRAGESRTTFAISKLLLRDAHDLIHKAVGWMLREVGKRVGEDELRGFLVAHATRMPRTALRYAIERFSVAERKRWLALRAP